MEEVINGILIREVETKNIMTKSMGDLPEKHNLVIFIIRFKPHYFCNISFICAALVILAGKLE